MRWKKHNLELQTSLVKDHLYNKLQKSLLKFCTLKLKVKQQQKSFYMKGGPRSREVKSKRLQLLQLLNVDNETIMNKEMNVFGSLQV